MKLALIAKFRKFWLRLNSNFSNKLFVLNCDINMIKQDSSKCFFKTHKKLLNQDQKFVMQNTAEDSLNKEVLQTIVFLANTNRKN